MGAPQERSEIEQEIFYGINNFLFFSSGEDKSALEDELYKLGELISNFKSN